MSLIPRNMSLVPYNPPCRDLVPVRTPVHVEVLSATTNCGKPVGLLPPPAQGSWFTNFFKMLTDPNVTPDKTIKLMGVAGGLGLGMSLFTGGMGLNLDTLLNVGALGSLVCPALIVPVAIGFGLKASMNLFKAVGSLLRLDFGGAIGNTLAAGLNLIGILPFGKVGQITNLFKNSSAKEACLKSIELCYGSKTVESSVQAVEFLKNLTQRTGQNQGLNFFERLGKVWQNTVNKFNAGRAAAQTASATPSTCRALVVV